jgi:hypothetical protein
VVISSAAGTAIRAARPVKGILRRERKETTGMDLSSRKKYGAIPPDAVKSLSPVDGGIPAPAAAGAAPGGE